MTNVIKLPLKLKLECKFRFILTSSTIDKKLENFEFIFEYKIAINFEFNFEIFVNFEFFCQFRVFFVNFEFFFVSGR